jgi:hypothetical protein
MNTPHGYPAWLYHVLLDEQPHYLAPRRLLHSPTDSRGLVVNPGCWFCWHGPLPADKAVRTAFADHLCPSDWMVWVDDPGTGAVWPFWVGYDYIGHLADMVPGLPPPHRLPPQVEWVLREAAILVPIGDGEQRRGEWRRRSVALAAQFQRGYVSLGDLIHPFHLGALRRYYRFHTRSGSFSWVESPGAERSFSAYNDAVACFHQHQLARMVSDVVLAEVRPSYTIFSAHQSWSAQPSQVDGERSEYCLSLCLDASPEPDRQNPWPLDLQVPDGVLRVWQHLGEGLLYRARYLPHARERLPAGCSSSSLELYYAD